MPVIKNTVKRISMKKYPSKKDTKVAVLHVFTTVAKGGITGHKNSMERILREQPGLVRELKEAHPELINKALREYKK